MALHSMTCSWFRELKLWGLGASLYSATYWYPIGKSLSSQSERSFRIPKQSIVMEPDRGKKNWLEEIMRRLIFWLETRKYPSTPVTHWAFPNSGGPCHTNHHVDIFWFQAIEELPSQADSFKVHKHSSKDFKSIFRNHLKWKSSCYKAASLHIIHVTQILSEGKVQSRSQNRPAVSQEDVCISNRRWF